MNTSGRHDFGPTQGWEQTVPEGRKVLWGSGTQSTCEQLIRFGVQTAVRQQWFGLISPPPAKPVGSAITGTGNRGGHTVRLSSLHM